MGNLLIPLIIHTCSLGPGSGMISFRNEVMPLLSQGGCNSGPCHGNLNGKGGLKLSLRGEDPGLDWKTLTHGVGGRRVNPLAPDESLLLAKASGQTPHEGAVRWKADGYAYRVVREWIAQGARPDPEGGPRVRSLRVEPEEIILPPGGGILRPKVLATLDDGRVVETSRLATLEPSDPGIRVSVEGNGLALVVPAGSQAAILVRHGSAQALLRVWSSAGPAKTARAANHPVDRIIGQRLASLGIEPAGGVDDGHFLRRVWLDLAGQLPPAERTRNFLADRSPEKRANEVDYLLGQPAFADLWALHWADLLRVEEKTLDPKGVRAMHAWLRRAFLENMPLDELARALVTARGSTYSHPPANFYRALRDPQTRAEAVAQVFLGVRIACARCHNHPFDRWTTDDYNAFTEIFSAIDYKVLENKRADDLDKHEFKGEQIVYLRRGPPEEPQGKGKKAKAPEKPITPARVLDGPTALKGPDTPQDLADWMTKPGNPFFAKAQANRVWRRLMGRGLVEPEDDFRLANPASHPELLEHLADFLARNRFDLRALVRHIALTETYARGIDKAHATVTQDDGMCAATLPRPIPAEQLLDAWAGVLEAPLDFSGYPAGTRTLEVAGIPGPSRRRKSDDLERFLRVFGKPERLLSCDCERTSDPTLAQTLMLVSGQLPQRLLTQSVRLDRLAQTAPGSAVAELYLAALCRKPTDRELTDCLKLLEGASDRRIALEDLAWALLGSREFLLRW
ncbi:MAG: DUF1549 and DUF1553 domain-containing protein [Gemmataceae bacterium]|nr:DUF1549 and DUF1553 domain-containing protein [Gemmataceae bacterium]